MTYPTTQQLLRLDLVFKKRDDPTDTFTLRFTNSWVNDYANGSATFAILKSVGDWGTNATGPIPEGMETTVVLDDSPGSFGYERRVSDLLQRYVIHNQTATLYWCQKEPNAAVVDGDWTAVWSAFVTSYRMTRESDHLIEIKLASVGIPKRRVVRSLQASDFASVPAASLGSDLPLIFGRANVRPVCCNAPTTNEAHYAYATTLSPDFLLNSGPTVYFKSTTRTGKDSEGVWESVTNVTYALYTTAVYEQTGTVASSAPYFKYMENYSAIAQRLDTSDGFLARGNIYLVTGAYVKLRGTGNGSYDPGERKYRISIYQGDANGNPKDELTYGELALSDYTVQLQGATSTTFNAHVKFNNVVHVGGIAEKWYYIAFSQDSSDPSGAAFDSVLTAGLSGSTGSGMWGIPLDSTDTDGDTVRSQGFVPIEPGSDSNMMYGVYSLAWEVDELAADADGLGMTYVKFRYYDNQPSQSDIPAIDQMDFIFDSRGMSDNFAGDYTGDPIYRTLVKPEHVLGILGLNYDAVDGWGGGPPWSDAWMVPDGTTYDYSAFDLSHNPVTYSSITDFDLDLKGNDRYLCGITYGPMLEDVLAQICREMGGRVVRTNAATSPQYSFWLWGGSTDPVTVFTDENSRLLGMEASGFEGVVNNFKIYYGRDIKAGDLLTERQRKEFRDYTKVVQFYYEADVWHSGNPAPTVLGTSHELYGKRYLSSGDYDLTGSGDYNQRFLLPYLGSLYAHPPLYATIEAPYFPFKDVQVMEVVEVVHTGLPNYFGTSQDATFPSYAGVPTEQVGADQYWKRAKRYRAIVEGRSVSFGSGAPVVRFLVRLLTRHPVDPT